MIDHLLTPCKQEGGNRSLDNLPASKNSLHKHLQHFLVFCQVEGFAPKTIQNYAEIIKPFVAYCHVELGIDDTSALTAHHIRSYLLTFKDRVKPYTFHDYFRGIRRFFNWLVDEKVLTESPMANMKPPRIPQTIIKPFHPDHLRQLLSLCDGSFLGLRNRAIILVFLDSGVRLHELANMQIDDIDFTRGVIKVMGKGAKERVVPIQTRAQKAILRYLLSRNYSYRCLWVSEERRPLTLYGVQLMIIKLGKLAGLKGVRCSPHTFRHTSATMMLDSGAGEFQVQAILGHSTLTIDVNPVKLE